MSEIITLGQEDAMKNLEESIVNNKEARESHLQSSAAWTEAIRLNTETKRMLDDRKATATDFPWEGGVRDISGRKDDNRES